MAANGNGDDVNDAEMQRLPDNVLRQVFKHLPAVSDIKNCRLVCRQWNRLAWDNIVFLLVVERLGPTRSCWKRATAPPGLAKQDRFLIRLIALPAAQNERAVRSAMARQHVVLEQTKLYFHQLHGVICKIQHKIKFVRLCIQPTQRELQVLQTLVAHLPRAELVWTGSGTDHFIEWAEFKRERQRPGRVNQAPLELRKLVVRWAELDSDAASVNVGLLSKHASFIRDISADDWRCIQQALNANSNSDGRTLVLEQCQKLVVKEQCDEPITTPFLKISEAFPILERLDWPINSVDPAPDYENLAKLTSLKCLSVSASQLNAIHLLLLHSLVELRLGESVLLPNHSAQFDTPRLTSLELASASNLQRLAMLLENDNPSLQMLQSLKLAVIPGPTIQAHLTKVLKAAVNLRKLEIQKWMSSYQVSHLLSIMSAVCNSIVAAPAANLQEVSVGCVVIPTRFDRYNCFDMLQRLVGHIKRSETAAVVTVSFFNHAAMISLLAELTQVATSRIDGRTVAIQASTTEACELTWTSFGQQQKLVIRVV